MGTTSEEFQDAMQDIINKNEYRKSAKKRSKAILYRSATYSFFVDTFSPRYESINNEEEYQVASNMLGPVYADLAWVC